MASSSSFTMLLVLVALGGVLVDGAGRPFSKPDEIASGDRLRVRIPSALLSRVSPLDASKTAQYAIQLQEQTLSQRSLQFCRDAKLECQSDIAILDPTLHISRSALVNGDMLQETSDLVTAARSMRFGEKDIITEGNEIALPETFHDSYPPTSFLPQSLAEKMPFTRSRMPELLDALNIQRNSNLAVMMTRTVAKCESARQEISSGNAAEGHKCVTSLEEMSDFVATSLPQAKQITALERSSESTSGEGQKYSKNTWKVLDSKLYNRAVVCKNSVFPYAVFECQDTSKTNMRIYNVEMQGRDGSRIKEVAACHEDSINDKMATMSKRKPAMEEAEAQACHWVTDSLIWAPTN